MSLNCLVGAFLAFVRVFLATKWFLGIESDPNPSHSSTGKVSNLCCVQLIKKFRCLNIKAKHICVITECKHPHCPTVRFSLRWNKFIKLQFFIANRPKKYNNFCVFRISPRLTSIHFVFHFFPRIFMKISIKLFSSITIIHILSIVRCPRIWMVQLHLWSISEIYCIIKLSVCWWTSKAQRRKATFRQLSQLFISLPCFWRFDVCVDVITSLVHIWCSYCLHL